MAVRARWKTAVRRHDDRLFVTVVLVSVMLGSPGVARAEPGISGVYRLESERVGKGCEDRWSFSGEDQLTVESGEAVVRLRWRLERGERGHWLVLEGIESNGRPDCSGNSTADAASRSARTSIYRLPSGDIAFCEDNRVTSGSSGVYMGKCFAWLRKTPAGAPGR